VQVTVADRARLGPPRLALYSVTESARTPFHAEPTHELAHFHKETIRIQKIMDEEFEQIEPEDWN
jgi:hypothetical protein